MIGIETVRVLPGSALLLEEPLRLRLGSEVAAIAIVAGLSAERQTRQDVGAGKGEPRSNDGTARAEPSTIRHEQLHGNNAALMFRAHCLRGAAGLQA